MRYIGGVLYNLVMYLFLLFYLSLCGQVFCFFLQRNSYMNLVFFLLFCESLSCGSQYLKNKLKNHKIVFIFLLCVVLRGAQFIVIMGIKGGIKFFLSSQLSIFKNFQKSSQNHIPLIPQYQSPPRPPINIEEKKRTKSYYDTFFK